MIISHPKTPREVSFVFKKVDLWPAIHIPILNIDYWLYQKKNCGQLLNLILFETSDTM